MKSFILIPNDGISINPNDPNDYTYKSVDSYIKKAIKLGKELYGDNFIIAEWKLGSWYDWYDTCNRYDCNGEKIYDRKKGKIK